MGGGVHDQPFRERRPFPAHLSERFPEYGRDFEIAAGLGVSVEAYWRRSPSERDWHERRWAKARETCQRCGLPRSLCSDSEAKFYPQREICYATMEREAANAKWQAIHHERQWHNGSWSSWGEKRSDAHPYHRDHGVIVGVAESDLRPDDRFLAVEKCGPPTGGSVGVDSEDENGPESADD